MTQSFNSQYAHAVGKANLADHLADIASQNGDERQATLREADAAMLRAQAAEALNRAKSGSDPSDYRTAEVAPYPAHPTA